MHMTFGEKEAIKRRLSQIDQLEQDIRYHFQLERKQLIISLNRLEAPGNEWRSGAPKVRRRTAHVEFLQQMILTYLKQEKRPVRGFAVQQYVEDQTGYHISNMSAFMSALMPKHKEIRKLGRGLYVYQQDVFLTV